MTNFEKMKYLHRNAGRKKIPGTVAEEAGKKMTKTSRTKKAQKREKVLSSGEEKGTENEECSGDPPEDIPG